MKVIFFLTFIRTKFINIKNLHSLFIGREKRYIFERTTKYIIYIIRATIIKIKNYYA